MAKELTYASHTTKMAMKLEVARKNGLENENMVIEEIGGVMTVNYEGKYGEKKLCKEKKEKGAQCKSKRQSKPVAIKNDAGLQLINKGPFEGTVSGDTQDAGPRVVGSRCFDFHEIQSIPRTRIFV